MKKQMSPSVIDLPADAGDPALTLLNIAKCSILAVILGIRLQCVCYIMPARLGQPWSPAPAKCRLLQSAVLRGGLSLCFHQARKSLTKAEPGCSCSPFLQACTIFSAYSNIGSTSK